MCCLTGAPKGGVGDGPLHVRGIAEEFTDMQSGIERNRDAPDGLQR